MTTVTENITTHIDKLARDFPTYNRDSLARVAWTQITEPGDEAAGALISEHGAERALQIIADATYEDAQLTELRERVLPRLSSGGVTVVIRAAARFGAQILTPDHEHWPTGLAELGNRAPHALYARGNTALLRAELRTQIEGSRASTPYGEHTTMELSAGLVERGHTIISSGAYGVSGMALRAALASGGQTIAVLAGGVDRFYPAGHDALLSRVVETGVVVSEMPVGAAPTKWRFNERSRISGAIAHATIITEAGARSASLRVAHDAIALERPVGVYPGPVTSAAHAGAHKLLRERVATLVTCAEEAAAL